MLQAADQYTEPDMEWESVRKWVFDQEEKFHISRRQLLRALKIDCALALPFFAQPVAEVPVNIPGMPGYQLRQQLHSFMQHPDTMPDLTSLPPLWTDEVETLFESRHDSLANLLLMSVSESPPVVVIACLRPKSPKPAVIRKRIPQMPPSTEIKFELVDEASTYCLASPGGSSTTWPNANISFGTGTLMGSWMISAHHVFRLNRTREGIDFKLNVQRQFDGKYCKTGIQNQFLVACGHTSPACYHPTEDVALGFPMLLHRSLLNPTLSLPPFGTVPSISFSSYMTFELAQVALQNKRVKKVGCSTNVTFGVINRVERNYLSISCETLGDFLASGDSGSLVLDAETNDLIGIGVMKHRNESIAFAVPLWKFFNWFVSLRVLYP